MAAKLQLNIEYSINLFDRNVEEPSSTGRRKRSKSVDSTNETRLVTFVIDENTKELRFSDQAQKDSLIRFHADCMRLIANLVRDGRDLEEISSKSATEFSICWLSEEALDPEEQKIVDAFKLPCSLAELGDVFTQIPVAIAQRDLAEEQGEERKSPRLKVSFGG